MKKKFAKGKVSLNDEREIATDMCNTVSMNDIQKMKLYIAAGIPVCYADYDGRTPLHISSCNFYLEMTQLLIEAGADKQAVDNFGNKAELAWLDGAVMPAG